MVPLELARRLRDAGLDWKPAPGDWFAVPDRGMDDEFFVLSDMTIRVYEVPEGPSLIGFNGTTEWALDDLEKEEAVWLPREDQLRDLLGPAFLGLTRTAGGRAKANQAEGDRGENDGASVDRFGGDHADEAYLVTTVDGGFRADTAAGAYGYALLHLLNQGPGSYPGRHV
jgi:hypothetical protein